MYLCLSVLVSGLTRQERTFRLLKKNILTYNFFDILHLAVSSYCTMTLLWSFHTCYNILCNNRSFIMCFLHSTILWLFTYYTVTFSTTILWILSKNYNLLWICYKVFLIRCYVLRHTYIYAFLFFATHNFDL